MTLIVIVFFVVYLGMLLGGLPRLKVNRASIALIGAVAILASGSITGKDALAGTDFTTLGLLFGLMLVSIQLEMAGMYQRISFAVGQLEVSPPLLLGLITLMAGGLSAFLTNAVTVVAMTPVILKICLHRNINPVPFLLGIAFASNSAAIATLIGGPQNMLIAAKLQIPFALFMGYNLVPALLALAVGWLMLCVLYRGRWSIPERLPEAVPQGGPQESEVAYDNLEAIKGVVVAVLLVGMFIFSNWNHGLLALTAGAFLLMNAHFQSNAMLHRIDWDLLLLFSGLFIVNAAMASTGLPDRLVADLGALGFDLRNPPILFAVTAVLSDLVSNIPSVMLLLPYAEGMKDGALMAVASGLSSNMLIIGSMANIIVVDAAGSRGFKISAGEFATAGVPLGILSMLLAAGWLWLFC